MSLAILDFSPQYIEEDVLPGLQALAKAGKGVPEEEVENMRKTWLHVHWLNLYDWELCNIETKAGTSTFIADACRMHVRLALEGVPKNPSIKVLDQRLLVVSELRERGVVFCDGRWPAREMNPVVIGNDCKEDPKLEGLLEPLGRLATAYGDPFRGCSCRDHVKDMWEALEDFYVFWCAVGTYENASVHPRRLRKLGMATLDLVIAISWTMEITLKSLT